MVLLRPEVWLQLNDPTQKNPWVIRLEGYKKMRAVTLGTGRKLLQASGARLVWPLPHDLSVLTPESILPGQSIISQ